MTDAEKITLIKALLSPDTVSDDDLTPYLELSKGVVLNKLYPFEDVTDMEVPARYEVIQCQVAVELWNKKGVEGELAHVENGISRTYASGLISSALMKQITPFVGSVIIDETDE